MSRKQAKFSRHDARVRPGQLTSPEPEPIQVCVPDVTSAEFAAEAHQQSLAVANSPNEKEDRACIDALSWFSDEGAE
jgi:hypothetical protein